MSIFLALLYALAKIKPSNFDPAVNKDQSIVFNFPIALYSQIFPFKQ